MRWKERGDSLTVKEINNVKAVLSYFLIKQGFEDGVMDLETNELLDILNRDLHISNLREGEDE